MRYHEKMDIIFMRDNGPRRSFRVRRSRLYLLTIFFISLPFLCILLSVQCWLLWNENQNLRLNIERFELDCQKAEYRAERLENLEALLQEANISGRELLIRQLGRSGQPELPDIEEESPIEPPNIELAEGPGHEEFSAIDKGRIKIDNVQVRVRRDNALRVGLDLRNPPNEELLTGEVVAFLITADGKKSMLSFAPQDAGNFRINKFKRAVMTARVPRETSLINSSVILEIRDQEGNIIYQNIFAVQR